MVSQARRQEVNRELVAQVACGMMAHQSNLVRKHSSLKCEATLLQA